MENYAAVVVRPDLNASLTTALERSKAGAIQPQAIDELYEKWGLRKTTPIC